VSAFLASVAAVIAHALGVALRPLRTAGPATPAAVPLVAMASPWVPGLSLGLPGRYTRPQTGGEP
jgi:hypothetical protein